MHTFGVFASFSMYCEWGSIIKLFLNRIHPCIDENINGRKCRTYILTPVISLTEFYYRLVDEKSIVHPQVRVVCACTYSRILNGNLKKVKYIDISDQPTSDLDKNVNIKFRLTNISR